MTQALEKPADLEAGQESGPRRIRWTRAQVHAMQDAGFFNGHRYELVEGELYDKMGQKPPHRIGVVRLRGWLISVFGNNCVQDQLPIDVAPEDNATSEPEPDASVTAKPAEEYMEGNPPASDILLVAEVSDTTISFDRNTKADLYARAGIQEYWIVDVKRRAVEVFRQPSPDGYEEHRTYREGKELSCLARPEAAVAVSDLLPPHPKAEA